MRRRDFYQDGGVEKPGTNPSSNAWKAPELAQERVAYVWRGKDRGYVKEALKSAEIPKGPKTGWCEHCGRQIGRGVGSHRKACAKRMQA